MKSRIAVTLCAGLLATALAGCRTGKEDHSKLEAQAKVSKLEAEKIALSRVPDGKIKEAEIEKEKGKLIWSFDIAKPGTKDITEVNVDALTGEIVAVEIEHPGDEAKEKKQEKDDDEKEGKN
jgi:hypothetical protein